MPPHGLARDGRCAFRLVKGPVHGKPSLRASYGLAGGACRCPGPIKGGVGEKRRGSQVILHSRASHPIFFIITWRACRQREPLQGPWLGAGRHAPPLRTDPAISDLPMKAETQAPPDGGQDAFKSAAGPRGASHRPHLGRQAVTGRGHGPNRPLPRRAAPKPLQSQGKPLISFP